jgi:hypothetical protein
MGWRELKPGDIAAIVLATVLFGCCAAYGLFPDKVPWRSSGFGPEWECKNPGHGEPVCIKKSDSKPVSP